jgi:hypothetical protein
MAKSRESRNVALVSAEVVGASCAALRLVRDEQRKTPNTAKAESTFFPGVLLCQRLDENARRMTSTLDAPFFILCIWKVLPLASLEDELLCLIPQDMAKARER